MDRMMEFEVTVCLGRGDGGDVCVSVSVSDEEYELLKQCCLEDCEPCDCKGLEDLCSRVEEAAVDESMCIASEYEQDLDCSSASCHFGVPYVIQDECEEELDEDGE